MHQTSYWPACIRQSYNPFIKQENAFFCIKKRFKQLICMVLILYLAWNQCLYFKEHLLFFKCFVYFQEQTERTKYRQALFERIIASKKQKRQTEAKVLLVCDQINSSYYRNCQKYKTKLIYCTILIYAIGFLNIILLKIFIFRNTVRK